MSTDSTLAPRDRTLLGIVALGAAVRVVYYLSKWNQQLLLNDSIYYSGQARQLATGVWFRELFVDQPGAEHGPLTSILMAPFSWGADMHRWQRLVTLTTGIVLVWVMGRFVAELAGRRAGLLAALIAALYPNLWINDGLVMSESISVLLVALTLWAAWRAGRTSRMRPMVLLGVSLGLGILARSELALFAPLLLAWVVFVRRRSSLDWRPVLVAGGLAVSILVPWVTFNLVRFERPVFLTTNDGTTLLGANCDEAYHGAVKGGWSVSCVFADPQYSMDEEPSVRSARQRSLAVHYAKAHVTDVPFVLAARVGRTADLFGLPNLVRQDVGEERPRWASWAGIVTFWLLAVLSVVGARRLDRRRRSLLLVPIVVVIATSLLFYGGHRIRSTAEPSLVAFTAVALVPWVQGRRLLRRPVPTPGEER